MMLLRFSLGIPQLVFIVLTLVSNLACPIALQSWLIVVVGEQCVWESGVHGCKACVACTTVKKNCVFPSMQTDQPGPSEVGPSSQQAVVEVPAPVAGVKWH